MKILIQNYDCKLINNLDSIKKHTTIFANINHNIYQIDQKIEPDIYILVSKLMNYEELYFCHNNRDKKIIIYHNSNLDLLELSKYNHISIIDNNSICQLYNPDRFDRIKYHKAIDTIDYVYFLDNDTSIPDPLNEILLPNAQHNIKLFGNKNIDHPQNIGFLTEDDKAVILSNTKNYICNNMFYAAEATICGCKILDTTLNPISLDISQILTYAEFIESML